MPALAYRTTLPKPDDPDIYEPIVEAITKGHPQTTAAALAGIHEDTLYHWRYQGQAELAAAQGQHIPWDELGSHAQFVIRIKEAEADMVEDALRHWRLGLKDWPAWCTLLERRMREHFGRNVMVDSTSTVNVNVAILPAGSANDIIARYAARQSLNNPTGETPRLGPGTSD